ncbi:hypothetical protein GCM10009556_089870 [Acrocarpospora pleiomorpha]
MGEGLGQAPLVTNAVWASRAVPVGRNGGPPDVPLTVATQYTATASADDVCDLVVKLNAGEGGYA